MFNDTINDFFRTPSPMTLWLITAGDLHFRFSSLSDQLGLFFLDNHYLHQMLIRFR